MASLPRVVAATVAQPGGGRCDQGHATLPPVASPTGLADAALAYLRRRERLLVRLERVNAALCAWAEWEANAYLPDYLQRPLRPPMRSRAALDGLHRMLTEEVGRLDGGATPEA